MSKETAILINPEDSQTMNRIGLKFTNKNVYSQFFGEADKKNVEALVDMFLNKDLFSAGVYLHGDLVWNILGQEMPKGEYGTLQYHVPYKEIYLAVNSGEHYTTISDFIDKKIADRENGVISELGKLHFPGLISASPTPRQPLSEKNVPIYSYRFTWSNEDVKANIEHNAPKDIVVGIYNYLRV